MRPDRQGGWIVELNSETVPRVLVNSDYYAQVSAHVRSKKEREYLNDRLQSANWLVKALHQRATTILKVASEIVRQQDAFFRKGVEHMKPLTLRDIATEIRSEEHTSELQSLMRISYAVFCLKKKSITTILHTNKHNIHNELQN